MYQTVYEEGRPALVIEYGLGPEELEHRPAAEDEASLTRIYALAWTEDRLTRIDEYDPKGTWRYAHELHWQGDLVRVDRLDGRTNKDRIERIRGDVFLRRQAGDYAQVFSHPDTRWEYVTKDGVETVTKFVGERPVERRRFVLKGSERRPLTVEQQVPDNDGLVTVESWQWDLGDRVVVERLDGRDVHLLDCSSLPTIESLVDPDCPPPMPLR